MEIKIHTTKKKDKINPIQKSNREKCFFSEITTVKKIISDQYYMSGPPKGAKTDGKSTTILPEYQDIKFDLKTFKPIAIDWIKKNNIKSKQDIKGVFGFNIGKYDTYNVNFIHKIKHLEFFIEKELMSEIIKNGKKL